MHNTESAVNVQSVNVCPFVYNISNDNNPLQNIDQLLKMFLSPFFDCPSFLKFNNETHFHAPFARKIISMDD